MLRTCLHRLFILIALACAVLPAQAQMQSAFSADQRRSVDKLAADSLASTGVPSASVAIVKDGQIVYLQAYGDARIEPRTPARPEMRYSIGSISKQFTVAAILLLQEQGKLSLDDKVSRFVPDLTRANEVTIRELLSHTSGYQDFWPQDYNMPFILQPTTAESILDRWASKALDFDPGTKWQYSNTNFVIAGVIVEKASGMPFIQFLRDKVLAPVGIKNAADTDQEKLGPGDPAGYLRYGLGPLRVAPAEGKGWMFAAGELAMPAEDLARWDISIIDQKLLQPSSYHEFESEVPLKNGVCTGYGLGVDIGEMSGHRMLSHTGEVSGFTADNVVFPDDHMAIVALTNQDAASAASQIARGIAHLLLATDDPQARQRLEQAKAIFAGLEKGAIDRSLFTEDANFYFSEEALKDFANGFAGLGTPQEFSQVAQELRGGMTMRAYRIKFPSKTLRAWTYEMPDGKLEQYQVAVQE
jgi:D-alanyl-D-alanine carboxypeptidase